MGTPRANRVCKYTKERHSHRWSHQSSLSMLLLFHLSWGISKIQEHYLKFLCQFLRPNFYFAWHLCIFNLSLLDANTSLVCFSVLFALCYKLTVFLLPAHSVIPNAVPPCFSLFVFNAAYNLITVYQRYKKTFWTSHLDYLITIL